MAITYSKEFPATLAQTKDGETLTNKRLMIQLNSTDPSSPIYVVDTTKTPLATWNPTLNTWSPLTPQQEFTGIIGETITIERFLETNKELLRTQTIATINTLTSEQQKAFSDANAFKGYTVSAPTNPEDNNPTPITSESSIPLKDFNESDLVNKSNLSFANYVYPENSSNQDMIQFIPMKLNLNSGVISPSGSITQPYGENENRREFTRVSNGGSVKLGIQGPIGDQNNVDWQEGRVGPLDAIMYNAAMKVLNNSDRGDIVGALQGAGNELLGRAGEAANQMFSSGLYRQLFASLAAGNIGLFTRATSLAINPNLELLFNQPQLRPFQFTFLLSASSSNESKQIKSIIKFFKYHMAPKVPSGTGLFLRSPHVFAIDYLYNGVSSHQSINQIAPVEGGRKACALTNMSTDYTPLGSYMTYKDSLASMVAYRINLTFMEITPVYDIDYSINPSNPSIGY